MSNENGYVGVNTDPSSFVQKTVTQEASKPNAFDPKRFLNLQLSPEENSKIVKVRLLPVSLKDGRVFLPINSHSLKVSREVSKSGFKTYTCLESEALGEKKGVCPLCAMSKKLFEDGSNARKSGDEALAKSLFKEAYALKKKNTFVVRLIDRDNEEDGVKFWKFNENALGNGIHDKLMSIYTTRNQESIDDGLGAYNIFDLYKGKDIVINVTKSQIPNGYGGMKDSISYNITDGGNPKPLSQDRDKANGWLMDEKTWSEVYPTKTPEYLEIVANGGVPIYNVELKKYVAKAGSEPSESAVNREISQQSGLISATQQESDLSGELPF